MEKTKMIDAEELKTAICAIRTEYFKENGFDNGVDYMANEVIDTITNMLTAKEK